MEKETVLEIEFITVWDRWAWKIIKQNEEILERGRFGDYGLGVNSTYYPDFSTGVNTLYIRGTNKYSDGRINICTTEEKEIIEKKVEAINEKYGTKKRWRAENDEVYYYINEHFEVDWFRDNRLPGTNKNYENGNYFQTKQEALEYAEYMKKKSFEWHEMRDNDD